MRITVAVLLLCAVPCFAQPAEPDTSSLYAKSYELEAQKQYEEAAKTLHGISPRDKTNFFFMRIGWLCYCAGHYEEAVFNYDRASRASPGALDAQLGLLSAYYAWNKVDDAEKTAFSILRVDPKNYSAQSTVASAIYQRKRYREAQEAYEEILKLYPSDLTMQMGLGWSLGMQRHYKESAKVFRDVLEVAPAYDAAARALGRDAPIPSATAQAYARSYKSESEGDYTAALQAMLDMPAESKQTYTYALRRGWLCYLAGDFENSSASYTAACKLAPVAIQPLLGKLQMEAAAGKWDEVLKTGEAALRLDPKNYAARSKVAYAFFVLNRFAESERVYSELSRDYPSDLSAQSGWGWALLKQDKKTEATRWFKAILAVCPTHDLAKKGMEVLQAAK